MRNFALVALTLVACSSAVTCSSSSSSPRARQGHHPDVSYRGHLSYACLPVIAKECGCVYDCGLGTSEDDRIWSVHHPFWKQPLVANVERWCVAGQCTDVFAAEIHCDVICAPKPADTSCAPKDLRSCIPLK